MKYISSWVGAFLLVVTVGCSGNSTPYGGGGGVTAGAPNSVSIAGFAFSPATLTVSAGTTVTWTNNDSTTHTATANGLQFDTSGISPGQSKSVQFNTPGTYGYHCSIHPSMTATIVVQ